MLSNPRLTRSTILSLALLLVSSALADTSKISPDLLPYLSKPSTNVNVIIQYNTTPCSGGGLIGGLLCVTVNLLGGVLHTVFSLINAVTATVSSGNLLSLSDQSNVTYISLDRTVLATDDYTTAAMNAPLAWSAGLDGTGIGIAIIDSGIYSHPDLNSSTGASRVVYRQSFVGGKLNDDYGHGTHVAGIAAGNGSVSANMRGVAPNAKLIDLRVLDANGASNDSVVIAAIEKAVSLKNTSSNVRVINLSLGRPIYESCAKDPLCSAVEAAWKKGVVVVVAAGNLGRNGYGTILAPGNSPHAITVGCMKTEATYPRSDDQIASYSSKGPTYVDLTVKPDVVAPGNLVVSLLAPGSTLVAQNPANVVSSSYFRLSGTSMATPAVSGTVALMLQKNSSLTPDTVKARLMKSA